MNRTKIKNYAPQARRDFLQAVTDRAAYLRADGRQDRAGHGAGRRGGDRRRAFPSAVAEKRKRLEERVQRHGFEQTMEAWPTHGSTGWSPSASWNCTATSTTATGS